LEALGQYTGIGANVQTGNMNRRAQGAADASSAYGEIRRQGFSEAAFRAESADTASRANQQTRLQSGIAAGDLASTQRSQSFDESFKRGAAADQTNQFNESNRIDITKYNQDYAQKERDAAWGRTTDYANTGLRASELNSLNSTRKYEAGQKTNADTYGRNRDVLTATDTVNTRENTLGNQQTDRRIGAEGLAIDNNNSFYNRSAGITGLDIANRNATTSGLVGIDFARGGVTQRNLDAEAARVVALNAENKADKRAKDAIWFEAGKHATVPGYGVL
jgi:hypothetical protein